MADALAIVEIPAGARLPFVDLLRLADDSEAALRGYLDRGRLFVLRDGAAALGEALVELPADVDAAAELLSIAVAERARGRGLGGRLLDHVAQVTRAAGVRRLEVATATSSLAALAFYLRRGFRPLRIDRDYFSPARGYPAGSEENGIPLRDRIWLDLDLRP
ncbi:MAG: GNAT family N-acetyltransferase [Myxococcales bacterium]|nr:GNAT family N-acetyltransferase [Myxococcales bacterium]